MFTGLSISLDRRREIVYEVSTHYSSRLLNWKLWANFHQQAFLFGVAILRARCITIWSVNESCYVRAWGALVGDDQRLVGNKQRRMKENAPIINGMKLSLDRIVEDVLRIIYV